MNEGTQDWEGMAKGIVKAELKRRNLTYNDLSRRLRSIGVLESEANIRNKISRGKFTAVFMLQCLKALDVKVLQV